MKRTRALTRLLGMMIPVCLAATTAWTAPELLDRIVAVVNEDIILLSELNDRIRPFAQRIRQQGYSESQERQMLYKVREEMINRLVDEKLTDQEIQRRNIQVDEAEIDSTIETIKSTNALTDEDLRRHLIQQEMTMEQYRDLIREQVLRSRLVSYQVKSKIVITEAQILDYYNQHLADYGGGERYHLRNILMRPPAFADDDQKQALREQMEALRSRAQAGEAFADLARAYSQSPAAEQGGDIGEFATETLSPQIRSALEGLQPGQTTAVLDTDQGLQLFYVEAILASETQALETVQKEIQQKLYNEEVDRRFVAWLEELRTQSHIKIVN